MGTAFMSMDQGSTLAWTQGYGSASLRERAREKCRDVAFGLALLVLVSGVASGMAAFISL